jgi:ribonucleoside-diphosphate reductase alpha chain
VLVGLHDDDPYEIFAFRQKQIQLPKRFKSGYLRKAKSGVYNLMEDLEGDGLIIEDIKEFFERDEDEALTRIISTALRHGADVKFVIEQLNKAEGNIVSFSKAIARTLKKYLKENTNMSGISCENCGSTNVAIEDGCFKCLDCGASKCS